MFKPAKYISRLIFGSLFGLLLLSSTESLTAIIPQYTESLALRGAGLSGFNPLSGEHMGGEHLSRYDHSARHYGSQWGRYDSDWENRHYNNFEDDYYGYGVGGGYGLGIYEGSSDYSYYPYNDDFDTDHNYIEYRLNPSSTYSQSTPAINYQYEYESILPDNG